MPYALLYRFRFHTVKGIHVVTRFMPAAFRITGGQQGFVTLWDDCSYYVSSVGREGMVVTIDII